MKKLIKEKIKYIQICPQCGSPDIETDFSNAAAIERGFFTKKCNNCEHTGTFFPSIPVNKLKKPKKISEIKNRIFVDTTFAKGIFNIEMIAMGAFLITVGLSSIFFKKTWGWISLLAGILLLLFIFKKRKIKITSVN